MVLPDRPAPVTVVDADVTCRKCGHVFRSYLYREIDGEAVLIDVDNDIVFDLVKTCHYCKEVYHWHTNHKQLSRTQGVYTDLFEKLESALHSPGKEGDGV